MSDQADVKSIDTLAFVKAAIAGFVHEANQALAEVELQGQRAIDWICVDQAAYWKAESYYQLAGQASDKPAREKAYKQLAMPCALSP